MQTEKSSWAATIILASHLQSYFHFLFRIGSTNKIINFAYILCNFDTNTIIAWKTRENEFAWKLYNFHANIKQTHSLDYSHEKIFIWFSPEFPIKRKSHETRVSQHSLFNRIYDLDILLAFLPLSRSQSTQTHLETTRKIVFAL